MSLPNHSLSDANGQSGRGDDDGYGGDPDRSGPGEPANESSSDGSSCDSSNDDSSCGSSYDDSSCGSSCDDSSCGSSCDSSSCDSSCDGGSSCNGSLGGSSYQSTLTDFSYQSTLTDFSYQSTLTDFSYQSTLTDFSYHSIPSCYTCPGSPGGHSSNHNDYNGHLSNGTNGSYPVHSDLEDHDNCSNGSQDQGLKDIHIDEEVKLAISMALERFLQGHQKEMEFPSSFTSSQRTFVHQLSRSFGFISKSKGKGASRFVTVKKKDGSELAPKLMTCNLTSSSILTIKSLIQRFPVTNKERSDLLPKSERGNIFTIETENREMSKTSGRLNTGIPQVPGKREESEFDSFRYSLPVFEKQQEIVQMIRDNRVTLIVGETGSGKTTQIPQFLLDDCYTQKVPCRIFCTQPRRLTAIAVAERVAAERREKIGQTVGYQIRLESRVSPKTLLTFCTNGVLLRTLMSGDTTLSTVTHIIVDEVHERDRFSDFLLIKLKEVLLKCANLKLVLSSAALDVNLFIKYFGSCPVLHIPGKPFEVKEFFLEDVLISTGYKNNDMLNYTKEKQREEKQQAVLSEWLSARVTANPESLRKRGTSDVTEECEHFDEDDDDDEVIISQVVEKDATCLDPWLIKEMDDCLSDIWLNKDMSAFARVFHLILTENVSVDYRHSGSSVTALMIAAGRGFVSQLEQLISMGANIHNKAANGWMAVDWAKHFGHAEIVDFLESYSVSLGFGNLDEHSLVLKNGSDLKVEERDILKSYHHSVDDEKVDLDLIMHLLFNICRSGDTGAVLIFLPAYEEIVKLKDRILFDDKRFADYSHRFHILMLHSNMQATDQKRVLKSPSTGVRKIILSTNIAETSITINDVAFVIDSGKMKEKSYDAMNCVTILKMVWISKASALQRKGRAGRSRPGICFRLYSRLRYQSMSDFQTPELLRMPVQELCLHTKLLAPINCSIAEFLMNAPDSPSTLMIKNAVQVLMAIDAMDNWEDLTELGCHLADLPVEPRLGKMVLCSIVLKCLDPILTIACTLAYRDPFLLPNKASQRRAAMLSRKHFSAEAFSDHMVLLRAFQAWQKSRADGWERAFCAKHFLSQAALEIIIGMRTQLLGQLRASGFVRARGLGDIRDVNTNSENWAVVKAALVTGMYPNVVHVDKTCMELIGAKEKKFRFHPNSVLSQAQYKKIPPANGHVVSVQALPTDWLIFDEVTRACKIASISCCTAVTPITITLFSGPMRLASNALQEPLPFAGTLSNDNSSDSESEDRSTAALASLRLDEWLNFKMDPEVANLLLQLRQKWQSLFLRRIRVPAKPWSQIDELTLKAIIAVITTEEQAAGLQQPIGIGQRPRPISSDDLPMTLWQSNNYNLNSGDEFSDESSPPESLTLNHKQSSDDQSDHCFQKPTNTCSFLSPFGSPPSTNMVSVSASAQSKLPVRYFIMKSNNSRNLKISQQKGVWSTTPVNEGKLNEAFFDSSAVFLVYSVQGSGHFQGFSRMTSEIGQEKSEDCGLPDLGGMFTVDWIRKEKLPFQQTSHLVNPWNENKNVQISHDGQELEPQVGEQLLKLWDHIPVEEEK
ncbi:3'-5' RNA helicase YTHDC2 isoform X2 [Tachyglossus aculeatus]|uniref:3'-5' RNA helicase YTHDC2 isoform X2 n=1 Tax=Tachyglossus aculeatus TaxID=9261 RepID=UPI0018F3B2D8|nr:3'-5' RNA helicase YTHDC2 isoform X2 [Tachyglossus aculeatus]